MFEAPQKTTVPLYISAISLLKTLFCKNYTNFAVVLRKARSALFKSVAKFRPLDSK